MFEVGEIICLRDYLPITAHKENGDKLFIVVGADESIRLLGISTSQKYFNAQDVHGKIVEGNNTFYCFLAGEKICRDSDFSFHKNTYFSMQSYLITKTEEDLKRYDFEKYGKLNYNDLFELVYLYKKHAQKRHVAYLDNLCEELSQYI